MARYGVDYYGRGYYGNVSLADYDATPFFATPIDYGKIFIKWTNPTGNYTGLRLLRNSYGFPQTADDGLVLVDTASGTQVAGAVPSEYFDPSGIIPPISPRLTDTVVHARSRNIKNWTRASNLLNVTVDDIFGISAGATVTIYGDTGVDGSYTVNKVDTDTYQITIVLPTAQTTLSGTTGFLLFNQLEQEAFYYYSIFVKTLSNIKSVSGAVGNGTTVTYTTSSPHGFLTGSIIGVTGFSSINFNVSGVVIASTPTTTTFTITSSVTGSATLSANVTPVVGLNTQWVRAGNVSGISVKDYGTQPRLYDALPDIYKVDNYAEAVDQQDNPTLRSFLAIFGFYYDLMKTYATLISNRYEVEKLSGQLIPSALQQFNFTFESELGLKRMRALLANALPLYQSKGSRLGLSDFINAFVGLEADIYQGKNLMLDYNNSSFEETAGFWTGTNATITAAAGSSINTWSTSGTVITLNLNFTPNFTSSSQVRIFESSGIDANYTSGVVVSGKTVTITTGTTYGTTNGTGGYVYPTIIESYAEASNPYSVANKTLGFGKITATAAGTLTLVCGSSTPVTKGIPVTYAQTYSLSAYIRSAATARTFSAAIEWYDYKGTLLSTSATGTVSSTTSGWVKLSCNGKVAPSGAVFAVPKITIASAAISEIHYIDAVQFEKAATSTWYQDARELQIFVRADRVNELKNPNFEYTTTAPWGVTGGTLAVATDEYVPNQSYNVPTSAGAGEVYSSGTAAVAVVSATSTSNYMKVYEGNSYTFSGYFVMSLDGSPTIAQQIYLGIKWYDSSYNVLFEDLSELNTLPFSAGGFNRLYVTATAPLGAAYAVAEVLWPYPTAAGYGILMDSLMFEKSAFANDYFDGNFGYADSADLVWEGTANQSRSHYYRNRGAIYYRLKATLPDFLPTGSTFATYYSQP
jgi:hypothetical protein